MCNEAGESRHSQRRRFWFTGSARFSVHSRRRKSAPPVGPHTSACMGTLDSAYIYWERSLQCAFCRLKPALQRALFADESRRSQWSLLGTHALGVHLLGAHPLGVHFCRLKPALPRYTGGRWDSYRRYFRGTGELPSEKRLFQRTGVPDESSFGNSTLCSTNGDKRRCHTMNF